MIKGAVLPVSKMFPNQRYSSSSLDSIDRPIHNPSYSTFSTPQPRRKLIKLTSTEKLNFAKGFNDSGSSSCSGEFQFQLATGLQRQIIRTAYMRRSTEADKRVAELEEKLALQEEELEKLRKSYIALEDKLKESEFKLQHEKKEKEYAEQELAELMGYLITLQKIHHISQPKQDIIELIQKVLNFKIEMKKIMKKLSTLENALQQDRNLR